jgi:hypothetical protein
MPESKKMLRGRAPLTLVAGNPGVHVYRGSVIEPSRVNRDDVERLVSEGYLEWVTPDGEGWKRAEESPDGDAGESVSVGVVALDSPADPDDDPGTVNSAAGSPTGAEVDPEVAQKRADARGKLPADGSMPKAQHGQDVWVEYLVAQGSAYEDVAKADKDELIRLAKSRQS